MEKVIEIFGFEINSKLKERFKLIIEDFFFSIHDFEYEEDGFYFFKHKEDDNGEEKVEKREDYFDSLLKNEEQLKIKFSALYPSNFEKESKIKKISIHINKDKGMCLHRSQERSRVSFHSESRLISGILDEIQDKKYHNEDFTFILSTLPCIECAYRIKSFNIHQLSRYNSHISHILICKNEIQTHSSTDIKHSGYETHFGNSLKILLDAGIRVFLYSINTGGCKIEGGYGGQNNMKAIKETYALSNLRNPQSEKQLKNILECIGIHELDYSTILDVEERVEKEIQEIEERAEKEI